MTDKKDMKNLLLFRVEEQAFALAVEEVKEILHMAELYVPPGLPAFMEGFIDIGGDAVPVLSITRLFFGSPSPRELYTPLVVFKTSSGPWGLPVDTVDGLFSVPGESLMPVKEENIFNKCVSAVFEIKDRKNYLLSPRRLLMEQEEKKAGEFLHIARERLAELETANNQSGEEKKNT